MTPKHCQIYYCYYGQHLDFVTYSLRPLKSVLPTLLEGQIILKFDRVYAKTYQCL
uniref:Uncharacterized protein n=1 Tax=Aegilops tauschii subsp. strangulata TaxID=200361 RepID=A0A453L8Y5_AEGTS